MSRMIDFKEIVKVALALGYRMESKRGALRTFTHVSREPKIFTFHEPHGGQVIYRRRAADRMRLSLEQLAELAQ
jgi:hypothetical protein